MDDSASGMRRKTKVVLFVEDDPGLREMFAPALREAGLFVAEVSSVEEAIEMGPRLRPDLVVLDRFLGNGDGWDVARAIRMIPSLKPCMILGFTASRGRSDIERALVAGCDAFLEKPCAPDQLVRFALGLLELPLPEEEAKSAIRRLA